jgi:hypothetical protein
MTIPSKPKRVRRPPDGSKLTPTEKEWAHFLEKVSGREDPDGCWLWTGAKSKRAKGRMVYGYFSFRGRSIAAHRFAYRADPLTPTIPASRPQLDHLRCESGLCVNSKHLFASNNKENSHRGNSFSALNARKEHCPKGHPYDLVERAGERLRRRCYKCRRDQQRASARRRRPEFVCLDCHGISTTQLCRECKARRAQVARAERSAARRTEALRQRLRCRRHRCEKSANARGALVCVECLRERNRQRVKRLVPLRYKKPREHGLCCSCGKPCAPHRSRCERCHQRHNERSRASRARLRGRGTDPVVSN